MTDHEPIQQRVLWWIIMALSSILLGGASNVLTSTPELKQRVAIVETQIAEQKHQLDSISRKLDRLLERSGK